MKPLLCLLLSLGIGVLAGCARKPDRGPDAASAAAGPSKPGKVVLPPDSPKLSQLRVEPVETAEVPTDQVTAPGKIEANPNRVSRVVLPVAGRIAGVRVRLGDAVIQGQPLLSIESPDADAAMSAYLQAAAAVAQAGAALVKAEADLERTRDLYEHQAMAKKEVLNAENALAQTKAAAEQAEASRKQALRRLEILGLKPGDFGQKVVVRAPISGKVLEINLAPGEYRNDTNAALMTIADLSTVWVVSDVPESYIRFIQLGEPVEIELAAYPGETFHGRVARLADTVDAQTRTVKVRAEMDNRGGRFRPEMFGSIRHTESTQSLPVVPVGAVLQGDEQSVVFRELSRGVFEQTPVTVGKRFGERIPVLNGLKAGDRVVVDGGMLLKAY